MDTTNPPNMSETEDKAWLFHRAIGDQIDKGQYNNALAWTLDLAKELQRLHAGQVRLNWNEPRRIR